MQRHIRQQTALIPGIIMPEAAHTSRAVVRRELFVIAQVNRRLLERVK